MDSLANNITAFFQIYAVNPQLESSPEVQALFGPLILLGEEKARELLAPRNEFIRVSDYQKKGDEIYKARVHYSFNYYLDGLASAAEIQVKPRDVEPHHQFQLLDLERLRVCLECFRLHELEHSEIKHEKPDPEFDNYQPAGPNQYQAQMVECEQCQRLCYKVIYC